MNESIAVVTTTTLTRPGVFVAPRFIKPCRKYAVRKIPQLIRVIGTSTHAISSDRVAYLAPELLFPESS
jgi:hypothetical protein